MAKKAKRLGLRIEMPEGWEPQPQTPGEPITLLFKDAAFQISIRPGAAEGEGWSGDDLADMTDAMLKPSTSGKRIEKSSGPCDMGTYGMALYADGEPSYLQAWFLSDGTHLMTVTLVDNASLEEDEIVDVIDTVLGMSLG